MSTSVRQETASDRDVDYEEDEDSPLIWHYVNAADALECQVYEAPILALCGEEMCPESYFADTHAGGEESASVMCEYCLRLEAAGRRP
jgi:hypothetical protein